MKKINLLGLCFGALNFIASTLYASDADVTEILENEVTQNKFLVFFENLERSFSNLQPSQEINKLHIDFLAKLKDVGVIKVFNEELKKEVFSYNNINAEKRFLLLYKNFEKSYSDLDTYQDTEQIIRYFLAALKDVEIVTEFDNSLEKESNLFKNINAAKRFLVLFGDFQRSFSYRETSQETAQLHEKFLEKLKFAILRIIISSKDFIHLFESSEFEKIYEGIVKEQEKDIYQDDVTLSLAKMTKVQVAALNAYLEDELSVKIGTWDKFNDFLTIVIFMTTTNADYVRCFNEKYNIKKCFNQFLIDLKNSVLNDSKNYKKEVPGLIFNSDKYLSLKEMLSHLVQENMYKNSNKIAVKTAKYLNEHKLCDNSLRELLALNQSQNLTNRINAAAKYTQERKFSG